MATCFGLWIYWRQRQSGYVSWYHDRWKKVDRDRRRSIVRSVRRGEAVSDPRNALLALEFIDHRRRQFGGNRSARRRWWTGMHFVLLALLALSVGLTRSDFKLIGISLIPFGSVLVLRLLVRRLDSRIAAAREENERLVGRFS